MYGVRGEQYGIWNTVKKCWQFGICEDTPMLAEARLVQKIGDGARKWRFEPRVLPAEMRRDKPEPMLLIELQRKDVELKRLKQKIRELESALAQEKALREKAERTMALWSWPDPGPKMDEEVGG